MPRMAGAVLDQEVACSCLDTSQAPQVQADAALAAFTP